MKTLWKAIGIVALFASASVMAAGTADFGYVSMGGSRLLHHTAMNPQGPVDTWPQMALAGTNAGDFQIVNDGCSGRKFIQSCTFDVLFLPTSLGSKVAVVLNPWTGAGDAANAEWILTGFAGAARTGGMGTFDPLNGLPERLPFVVSSVAPGGTANGMFLSATMSFDGFVYNLFGDVFLGAYVPPLGNGVGLISGGVFKPAPASQFLQSPEFGNTWYISNGSNWLKYMGGPFTPHRLTVLNSANAQVDILNNAYPGDVCGTEFYVGYGLTPELMLTNNTYGKIYTVVCNFDFKGHFTEDLSNLTFSLTADVQVATPDVGYPGNFYVGRLQNGAWSFLSGNTWTAYTSGDIPVYSHDILSTRRLSIFSNQGVSALANGRFFVGYGRNESDMIKNMKYGQVYP